MTSDKLDIFEVDMTAISGVFYNIGVIASGISTEEIIASNRRGQLVPLDHGMITKERITAIFAMLILEFSRTHGVSEAAIMENIQHSLFMNEGVLDGSNKQGLQ